MSALPEDVRRACLLVSDEADAVDAVEALGFSREDAQSHVRDWKAEQARKAEVIAPSPLSFDFDAADEPTDWLVHGIIERGTVVVLSGDTGSAKSIITSSLVRAALADEPWLDHATDVRHVLVIDEENPERLARKRLRALGITNAMRDRLRYYSREGLALCDDAENDAWLRRELDDFRPDLVVIDTLMSATAVGDTNSNGEAVRVMKALRRLAADYGCAVLLMHHERKRGMDDTRSSGQHMMGARQWAGQADAHMTLTVESDFISKPADTEGHEHTRRTFVLRGAEKDRDGRPNGKRRIAVESERDGDRRYAWMRVTDEGTVETDTERDVVSTAILGTLREADGDMAPRDIAAALGREPDDGTFKRALSDLAEAGKVERPRRGRYAITEHGRETAGLPL